MSTNFISLVNEYCQKNKITPPVETYRFTDGNWICCMMFQGQHVESPFFHSKQAAKMSCAEMVYKTLVPVNNVTESHIPKNLIILIDGDQRMDCWKWLAESKIHPSTSVYCFISPTTPDILAENVIVYRSKSTSKDSADANMLIHLGRILALPLDRKIIIVSADHILVQAAQDYGLDYAYNLSSFKEVLKGLEN